MMLVMMWMLMLFGGDGDGADYDAAGDDDEWRQW